MDESDLNTQVASSLSEILLENAQNEQLVRRHSLSLRTPPKDSLAAQIIEANSAQLEKTKLVIEDLKESLSDFALSDFASAMSSSSSDEESTEGCSPPLKSTKGSRNKRRASQTPPKEFFVKKKSKGSAPKSLVR